MDDSIAVQVTPYDSPDAPVILVADDEQIVREFLITVLRRASYSVLAAADGVDALEISRNFNGDIALLLTDMDMPHIGGNKLSELIARERPGIRIPQISGTISACLTGRNPAIPLLEKPFSVADLIAKIQEVLTAPSGSRHSITTSLWDIQGGS